MDILVTGGGGFLGTALIKRLLTEKSTFTENTSSENIISEDLRIISFSRKFYPHLQELGVTQLQGDLANPNSLKQAMKMFSNNPSPKIKVVFHVAALASMWECRSDFYRSEDYRFFSSDFYRINVLGTKNILDFCQENQIEQLIYTSSPSVVFGKNQEGLAGVDESTPYPPAEDYLSFYARSKSMAEQLVLKTARLGKLQAVALRPHLIWGPGDPHLLPQVVARARRGKLRLIGDGKNQVDITYIDNAVESHLRAWQTLSNPLTAKAANGKAFFIGDKSPVYLWRFINQVLEIYGIPPLVVEENAQDNIKRESCRTSSKVKNGLSVSSAYRIGYILEKICLGLGAFRVEPPLTRFLALQLGTSHYFNHHQAESLLGYHPLVSLEEGLAKLKR